MNIKNTNRPNYAYVEFLKDRKSKPYRLRLQINGKRKIYYFTTEEALAFHDEARGIKDKVYRKGEIVHYSVLTFFREWIKEKELTVSPGYISNIHNSFKHLKDIYGDWFSQLSKDDCMALMKKDSSTSLRRAFSALSEINKYSLEKYNYGFTWNIDGFIKGFKPKVKSNKRVRSFYRDNEMSLMLNHLKGKNDLYWYHFFRLSFSLGARIGEICSLKKENFDKSERVLIINSTLQSAHKDGKNIIQDSSTTKNGESRIIALSASAVDSVEYFLSINKDKTYPFLIPRKNKSKYQFISKSSVNNVLKRVSAELGIVYLSFHCAFRKTFATQVAKASKKSHRDMISAIQKQLGHKSPQMTLHYIQAIELGLDDELNELDKILNPS